MIYIDKNREEPLYLQIYNQVKNDIMDGSLKEGQILSGSRKTAGILHVSRNTVDNAYGQLAAEGYIAPVRGIGYAVTKLPPAIQPLTKPVQKPRRIALPDREHTAADITYDLTNGSHTGDLFPDRLWRRFTLEFLEQLHENAKLSSLQDRQGELFLRRQLLPYLRRIRGINCTHSQIIVTSGIQHSLEILCKILAGPSAAVIMEEPGYHRAAAVFQNNGFQIHTVPVDENGIITADLPCRQDICVLYSTPSHQFPTGVTMPIGRRYELLQWAAAEGTYIIEDDFDSELRYYEKPIPSLQSIDENQQVIYLGTFSKTLSPAIRMGYMILPPQLLELYQSKYLNYNCNVPLLNQYVVSRIIETGHYERHIRRLNHIFRKRLEQFTYEFSPVRDKIKLSGNGSGQYFLLEFSDPTDQNTLIEQALEHGVKVYSTMQFWREKAACPPNTLFLGFSKINLEDIPDCAARLKTAWAKWL